jgi:hypothetical protein
LFVSCSVIANLCAALLIEQLRRHALRCSLRSQVVPLPRRTSRCSLSSCGAIADLNVMLLIEQFLQHSNAALLALA